MALLRNNALVSNPALYNQPDSAVKWQQFIKALNAQAVDSLDIKEFIRIGSPAPSYLSGTGIWEGMDSGVAKLFVGNSSGAYITWDGTQITLNGGFTWKNQFSNVGTVTWSGFSSPPGTGNVTANYNSNIVTHMMGTVTANYTGTSNSTSFSVSYTVSSAPGGPYTLWGSPFQAIDNGNRVLATFTLGWSSTTLTLTFYKFDIATGQFSATGWTNSGTKGFYAATLLQSANIFQIVA